MKLIAKVRINKSNNQMLITVPKDSGLQPGDMVWLDKLGYVKTVTGKRKVKNNE